MSKINKEELDKQIENFESRMEKGKKKEQEEKDKEAEERRQSYLKRTGRTEYKP